MCKSVRKQSLATSGTTGVEAQAETYTAGVGRQGAAVRISPIERLPKISQQVAGRLRRFILDGQLADGDQLPPETQLATEFGVSRPMVREAFRILETEGLIEVGRGSRTGARVNSPSIDTAARYAAFALRGVGATLAETYDAQLAIEPYAVRLLAERQPVEAIAQLEERLIELERLTSAGALTMRSVALARFHHLIVALTGNRTLNVMAETLAKILEAHQARHQPAVDPWAKGKSTPAFRDLGTRSIRKLLDLIKAGDVEGAEAHWRTHLTNAAAFWLSESDPATVINVED